VAAGPRPGPHVKGYVISSSTGMTPMQRNHAEFGKILVVQATEIAFLRESRFVCGHDVGVSCGATA